MPLNCCVIGCRGNYRGTKEHPIERVSVFRFPDDAELRAKWRRAIPRENLVVSDNTVVCEKHFAPHFVLRVDTATLADGSVLSVPRKVPKLTPDAYPSYFPNTPKYLSTEPPTKRKAPDCRRAEMYARDEQVLQEWLHEDSVTSYAEFCGGVNKLLDDYTDWTILRGVDCMCICATDVVGVPRITLSLKIDKELHVTLYKGNLRASNDDLAWALGHESKLICWSQLSTLLSHFCEWFTTSPLCLFENNAHLSSSYCMSCITN